MIQRAAIHLEGRVMRDRADILQILIALILTLPVLAVAATALGLAGWIPGGAGGGGAEDFRHLAATRLAGYIGNTLLLMAGVGALALLFGVSTAWITSRYDFPLRRILEWALVLPAAVPPYLVAYTYTDFLEYAGPVQSTLRAIFGWQDARDYFFFAIRSPGGAITVMAAVLYPYVYLTCRAAFRTTSKRLFEAAIVAGRRSLLPVALPLARGGIAAGLILVLMETVSDFGTVEYFAVDTLTLGIFNVWLGMGNIALAAQLALAAAILVLLLLWGERATSRHRGRENIAGHANGVPQIRAVGMARVLLPALCLIPVGMGFILPVGVLAGFVIGGMGAGLPPQIMAAVMNTVMVAVLAAMLIMGAATYLGIREKHPAMAYGRHGGIAGGMARGLTMTAAMGYAFPGVILALGVLAMTGAVDGMLRAGGMGGAVLTGSLAALILGYMARFHAIGYGTVRAGLERIPANLMAASRVMGHRLPTGVFRILLPLLRPSLLVGLLLAFTEVMKELPLSLLLRPFNFETLATITYRFAHDEMLEAAAIPALIIVATGLIPVVIINRALAAHYR